LLDVERYSLNLCNARCEILYYSDRLLELPLALIGIALATVALAKLSGHFANKDEDITIV
jgi:peptidoglycan biosynthesis protein MviN/MurJ (putative lipid II flippase)